MQVPDGNLLDSCDITRCDNYNNVLRENFQNLRVHIGRIFQLRILKFGQKDQNVYGLRLTA